MNAADIMTKNPISVAPDAAISEVLQLMLENEIRHIPVVARGQLEGVISDRDLRRYQLTAVMENLSQAEAKLRRPVSDLMTGDVISVGRESDITEIIDILLENKIGAVTVVDEVEGGLVGIVSYMDVLRVARNVL
jgi:acetoin utilization protein AcuB